MYVKAKERSHTTRSIDLKILEHHAAQLLQWMDNPGYPRVAISYEDDNSTYSRVFRQQAQNIHGDEYEKPAGRGTSSNGISFLEQARFLASRYTLGMS